jgi:predicted dinucleotide-binding enzyme
MLTVPLKAIPDLGNDVRQELQDKIVLDTGNAYERRDGLAATEATAHPKGSAGWSAAMFPGARWVKAFNTVYFKTLETEAHRDGDRVGILLASDDADALDVAAGLVEDAGFDPVILGELARGKEFEPNTPMYNTGKSGRELREYFSVS